MIFIDYIAAQTGFRKNPVFKKALPDSFWGFIFGFIVVFLDKYYQILSDKDWMKKTLKNNGATIFVYRSNWRLMNKVLTFSLVN